MYPPNRQIPASWPVQNPELWNPPFIVRRVPDYFSMKSLLPANWFPKHTIAGKIFSSPLLDPLGAALNKKSQQAETDALKQINAEYDQTIADNQAKLAAATQAQQDTASQAVTADQNKNMMLIVAVVVVLGIGLIIIFKKKK